MTFHTCDYFLLYSSKTIMQQKPGVRFWGSHPPLAVHPSAPGRVGLQWSDIKERLDIALETNSKTALTRVRPQDVETGTSPLRRGTCKVCVCNVVAASINVGLGGHKQRFLVNQCLLSCCINTIIINRNDQSIWA